MYLELITSLFSKKVDPLDFKRSSSFLSELLWEGDLKISFLKRDTLDRLI